MDNIYEQQLNKYNMKSIIKSIELLDNVVTVVTKSNVVKVYTLKSNKIARQYYNDILHFNRSY